MNQAVIKRHLNALAELDRDVRRGLKLVSYPKPRIREPGFETLLATIVSQQISTDAAAAIMTRIRALLPEMRARDVLRLQPGALREAGLSTRKVEYVEGLARAITEKQFVPEHLTELDDEDAIAAISALRGFGRWSAEIYLMFCLQRSDIFPAGDLALRVGLQKLKRLEQPLDEAAARQIVESWAPYRSAASLFLWHYYRGAPT